MKNLSRIIDDIHKSLTDRVEVINGMETLREKYEAGEFTFDDPNIKAMPEEKQKELKWLLDTEESDHIVQKELAVMHEHIRQKFENHTNWIWFDVGEIGELLEIMPDNILKETTPQEKFPFPFTALSGKVIHEDGKVSYMVWFVTRLDDGGFEASVALVPHYADHYMLSDINVKAEKLNDTWKCVGSTVKHSRHEESVNKDAAALFRKVPLAFLKVLKCTNVTTEVEKFPAKLNKKRQAKGERKGFDKHVLVLRPHKSERGEDQGGTHSSPRLHFRRGHVRKLGPDRYTWVRECMVGREDLGVIEKTYQVETTSHEA